jgi:hypothetical protein
MRGALALVLASIALVACPAPCAFAQWVPNGIPVGSTGQLQEQDYALIAPDGTGGCFVAWSESRINATTDYDIYLQHILPSGTLDPQWAVGGIPICDAPGAQQLAELSTDDHGGVLFAWLDYRSSLEVGLYAERVTASGLASTGWVPNGTLVCSGGWSKFPNFQGLSPDGSGGAYLSWGDERDGTERPRLTHVGPDGSIISGWPVNGKLVVDGNGPGGAPIVLPEPDGCLAVWGDTRGRTSLGFSLYAIRLTSFGDVYPGWPTSGAGLLTTGTLQEIRRAVPDGAGGAIAAWDDNRVGVAPSDPFYYDIYAQHVLADGTVDSRWPTTGLGVCTAPSGQYDFDMDTDGASGAVLMWEDSRAGFFQMYGQRILADASVAPGWTPNGTMVSNTHTTKFTPRIAGDGRGGFYGVWEENLSSMNPLNGQHMRGDGSVDPAWGPGGESLALPSPGGNCDTPAIAADGFGGALLTYRRFDPSPWIRMYALRIQTDGPVPTLLSFADYDTGPGRVTLRWEASDASAISATVERSPDGSAWTPLGTPRLEGTDLLIYDDLGVSSGQWSYRLSYVENGVQRLSDSVTVEVSAVAQLALGGFRPNPATSSSAIAFSLPDARPARLEILDVRGRILLTREVGGLGAGTHNVRLSEAGRLGAGVYWVRLVRPETTLTRKGVVAG